MSSTCIFLLIFLPGLLWKPMTKFFSELQSQCGNRKGAEPHCSSSINSMYKIPFQTSCVCSFSMPKYRLAHCQDVPMLPVQHSSEITAIYNTLCEPEKTLKNTSPCSLTAHLSCLQRLSLSNMVETRWMGHGFGFFKCNRYFGQEPILM